MNETLVQHSNNWKMSMNDWIESVWTRNTKQGPHVIQHLLLIASYLRNINLMNSPVPPHLANSAKSAHSRQQQKLQVPVEAGLK